VPKSKLTAGTTKPGCRTSRRPPEFSALPSAAGASLAPEPPASIKANGAKKRTASPDARKGRPKPPAMYMVVPMGGPSENPIPMMISFKLMTFATLSGNRSTAMEKIALLAQAPPAPHSKRLDA